MNLYHYCPNAAFVSIISGHEIWASDFSLSNDLLEGKWIGEIFKACCKEKGVRDFEQNTLLEDLAAVSSMLGGVGFCMSEEPDLLSQWRAYADDGAGVSIGFNKEYFDALGSMRMNRNDGFNVVISRVEYDIERQREMISEHGDEIIQLVLEGGLRTPSLIMGENEDEKKERLDKRRKIMFGLFLLFFPHFCSLKNPAFAEEKEWRAISHVIRGTGENPLKSLASMEFRPHLDRVVPYRRIALENVGIEAITEVILGPKHVTPEGIVEAMLRKYSVTGARVRRSSASYR
jgi:hypothetical protein